MGRSDSEIGKMANEVIQLSKSRLYVDVRFLSKAFDRFVFREQREPEARMATDGREIIYSPAELLRQFQADSHMITRILLHITMHCILGHPFKKQKKDERLWNIACDISVENIINELEISSCSLKSDREQEKWLFFLKEFCPKMTAEELYNYFLVRGTDFDNETDLAQIFVRDSHELWYAKKKNSVKKAGKRRPDEEAEGCRSDEDVSIDDTDELEEKIEEKKTAKLQKEWKRAAKLAEQDLKIFSRRHGRKSGSLMDSLLAVTFEECDYGEFLRRFGEQSEVMQLSDDEFDMIYYTYGLKKYKNVALIEPLEYKDDKRIREFVIAIDTSGSVQGEIVQTFLQRTCNVLRQEESFSTKVQIYLIQCDAEVQSVQLIRNLNQLQEIIPKLKLKGFGGTDFRPVFEYVDALMEERKLTNLNGLIYFTDGVGTYPEKMPSYKTAFVFNRDDYISPNVPYWAIKAVLTTDNIRVFKEDEKWT